MACPGWEDEDREDGGWVGDYEDDDLGEDDEFAADEEFSDDDDELEEYDEEGASDEDEEESDLDALIDEGEALIEEGEYLEALTLFREASERFPESPLALFHVGQTALMLFGDGIEGSSSWQDDDDLSGYYEEASSSFDAALAIDAEFYPALNGQGTLAMLLDNPKAAIEAWEQSLEVEEDQEDIVAALEEARTLLRKQKKK